MSPRLAAVADRASLILIALLLAGFALRIWLSFAVRPAYAHSYDSLLFVDMARGELFSDPTRTVGYPILLRALHGISSDLDFTIQVQHLLGIATALVLYATVRRLGAPVWAGIAAAAAVLLPLDQIFLEHLLMAEAPYALPLSIALYASVRALDSPRSLRGRLTTRHAWIAAAGAALGLSGWLRPVSAPLLLFLALWFALSIPGPWLRRIGHGALAAGAGACLLLGYFALSAAETGHFGLSRATGWALYSRTAPFADCSRFEPPPGTRRLCESTPTTLRPGPDFYAWQPDSPARRQFGEPPNGDQRLFAFAREAIEHQPLSYLKVVGRDLVRYFHPAFSPQDFSGLGYEEFDVEGRSPGVEDEIMAAMNAYYDDESLVLGGGRAALGEIQDIVRVHPKLMLAAALLALAGIWLSRGRVRAGLVLLLGVFLISILIPPATVIWSSRYAIPVSGPLIGAGAIGLWLILRRLVINWTGRPA